MTDTIDAIGDRVSPSRIAQRRVDRAKTWAGGVRERVMGSAPSISMGSPMASTSGVLGSAKEGAHHAAEAVSDLPATVGRQAGGNPLVAGAIAFGIGAMLASVLPETGPEHAAVEQFAPQIQAATDAAKDMGQQAVGAAKDSAQSSMQDLKQSVSEKADSVKSAATDAATEVKQQATSGSSSVS